MFIELYINNDHFLSEIFIEHFGTRHIIFGIKGVMEIKFLMALYN